MPLVLSLKKGQDFFVGDERFVVEEVDNPSTFKLRHAQKWRIGNVLCNRSRTFDITDAHATEVLPDVFVSAGDNPPTAMARVVINAPPEIFILRGEKRRSPPVGAQPAYC